MALEKGWMQIQHDRLQPKLELDEQRLDHNLLARLECMETTGSTTHAIRSNLVVEPTPTTTTTRTATAATSVAQDFHSQHQHQQPSRQQPVLARRKRGAAGTSARERSCKVPPPAAGKRSSIYRGVTRHRWTGRYEAHLWDKNTWNHTQNKKGKQVYLGAYDDEEAAARAYDLAALKYWGPGTLINFPVTDYTKDIEEMQNVTREEYLASLRRKSSGFSRGVSKYRGVARHHHNGRWEARIGRVFGNKYLYLGTYSTQEEAAAAYDMAAIEYRGLNAVTNFDLSRYIRWLRPGASIPAQDGVPAEQQSQEENQELSHKFQGLPRLEEAPKLQVWPSQGSSGGFYPQIPPSLGLASYSDINDNDNNNINMDKGLNCQLFPRKHNNPPTALGLLLQSSMFKQMLEKTSGKQNETEGGCREELHLVGSEQENMYVEESEISSYSFQPETFTFFENENCQRNICEERQQRQQHLTHEVGEDGPQGLSLWSSFGGSNLSASLPLSNAL